MYAQALDPPLAWHSQPPSLNLGTHLWLRCGPRTPSRLASTVSMLSGLAAPTRPVITAQAPPPSPGHTIQSLSETYTAVLLGRGGAASPVCEDTRGSDFHFPFLLALSAHTGPRAVAATARPWGGGASSLQLVRPRGRHSLGPAGVADPPDALLSNKGGLAELAPAWSPSMAVIKATPIPTTHTVGKSITNARVPGSKGFPQMTPLHLHSIPKGGGVNTPISQEYGQGDERQTRCLGGGWLCTGSQCFVRSSPLCARRPLMKTLRYTENLQLQGRHRGGF